MPDVYGQLKNKAQLRSLIDRYFDSDNGKGIIDDPGVPKEFLDLIEVGRIFEEEAKGSITLEQAHKIHDYDKLKGRMAEAKGAASAISKAQNVKPTVGVAATGQKAASSYSDKDLEAMANGEIDIPDEWLDDRMPNDKMPTKLKNKLLGIAA
jgi:hypothetical protein